MRHCSTIRSSCKEKSKEHYPGDKKDAGVSTDPCAVDLSQILPLEGPEPEVPRNVVRSEVEDHSDEDSVRIIEREEKGGY